MALTSTSTRADIKAAYLDNLDYDLAQDVAKCRDCIQALRFLIHATKEAMAHDGSSVRDDIGKYQEALDQAVAWLRVYDDTYDASRDGGHVRHFDLRDFRT